MRLIAAFMSFALLASLSNNVEVAFGCDANGNGPLEDSETAFAIGWDCGEWFFRDVAADVVDSCGASSFALAGYAGLVLGWWWACSETYTRQG